MQTGLNHAPRILRCAIAVALLSTLSPQLTALYAQGTAFTYQGRLFDTGNPATGIYDLQFTIYDSTNNPGVLIAGPLTNSATGVTNGLFTVTLDFGAGVFNGADRWLDIAVRTNGSGAFTNLAPRQKITPSPYAVTAGNVTGPVAAGQISGTVPLAELPAAVVTNNETGVNISGTFRGNGAGVTNLDLRTVNSLGAISVSSGNFVLSSSPAVGSAPNSVITADVNGNGKMDLISANFNASSLTVLINNGSGGFSGGYTLGVGNGPFSVVAADVNGDGKVDLICANYNGGGAGTLTVLTNNGSGGFFFASSPGVGNGPVSVVAADVNGDGRVDLISANESANSLTVLTNNGSGGFVLAATLSTGTSPRSVVAADVNGDGKVDLISANSGNNTLTVLTNNGSGGFVLAATLSTGNDPDSVVAADVNGDGKVDLICANYNGGGAGTLTVLTNNGSGGFVLSSSPAVGAGPFSVVAADVNGDGRVDLISANHIDNTLSVLFNIATVSFNGNVGIGTTSPGDALDVNGIIRGLGFRCRQAENGGVGGNVFNFYWTGSSLEAYIDTTHVGTVSLTSDSRLKKDIQPLPDNALARVLALKPSTFKYKDIPGSIFTGDGQTKEGFIAGDLQRVIPSAVNGDPNARTSNGQIQPQTVNIIPVVSVLTKAVQEQQQEIDQLKATVKQLEQAQKKEGKERKEVSPGRF